MKCAALLGVAALAACDSSAMAPTPVTLTRDDLVVTFRPADGTFDVARGGTIVFRNATADALFRIDDAKTLLSFNDSCARDVVGASAFSCSRDGITLTLAFDLPAGERHMTASLTLTNHTGEPITVLRLAPVVVDAAAGGALLLGDHPSTHRILENGRFALFDQTAQLETGDVARFSLANVLPIPLRGSSVSNWNQVVADVTQPSASLVAGYLTFERSIPTLGIAWDAAAAKPDGARTPFTTWAAENAFLFHGKPVAPEAAVASELLYLDPLPPDPLAALEHYADVLAASQHIVPWPKRTDAGGAPRVEPNGWNSWSGGGSTGGYGQSIDAALVAANLDVATRELRPFGMSGFQIDDGWQRAYGDWQWRPDRFPTGGAGAAGAISTAGFVPGLWIGAFSVDGASQLAQQHPDWLQPAEGGALATFAKDRGTVDLSNPAVRDWLHSTFADLKAQGFGLFKVDFTYYALLGRPADPSLTAVEAWRLGWKEVRAALGPDTFLYGIGVMGSNIGTVDGMRTTLDNGPKWEEDNPDDVLEAGRSFKSTVRTGSRRWFYQDRVFVDHHDALYFRSDPTPGVAPLSLDEARTFATWMGLMGGFVDLGDKLADMEQHPEWIDVVRRLLPAWPAGARPVDVMLRDYPEQLRAHVQAPAGEWDVLGLFNWGTNRDFSQNPPAALPEAPRTFTVDTTGCGGDCLVFEFWSERFLGRMTAPFQVTVAPRQVALLALRAPTGQPQLLGDNRHLFQGANDLGAVTFDAATKTLATTVLGAVGTNVAPFEHHLAFYAPPGFLADHALVDGVAAPMVAQAGEVVTVKFTLPPSAQGRPVAVKLLFK